MKLNLEMNLDRLSDEEIILLKKLCAKCHCYSQAQILLDYEQHNNAINILLNNNSQKTNGTSD